MSIEFSSSTATLEASTSVPESIEPTARPVTMETTVTMETDASGKKTVCPFFVEGKCRFGNSCFNFHPGNVVFEENIGSTKNKGKKKGSEKRKKRQEDEEDKGKKPSMKTAGDVRKRIQWDRDLNKDNFTVGYLDRFLGVLEKPFTAFSWEHLALVDINQLAIPQHRIQYFSYRGTKVWDKNEWMDNVFGSTGNHVTIQQVMEEVDAEIQKKRQTYNSDDSDSDDDVVLTTDASAIKETVDARQAEFNQLRASHFLCIRVFNDELKSAALEVQEKMTMEEPILHSCAMPLELFHVTLAMIRIDGPEAMEEIIKLLQELKPKLQEMVTDPEQRKIFVRGLSTFGARVLYTKLQVPEAFSKIVEALHQAIEKIEGLVITNHFDFVPHMTLLKVNRVIARERRSKYINSSLYSDYIDRDFGVIDLNNVNLCIIDDRRGYDGFYLTCKKIQF